MEFKDTSLETKPSLRYGGPTIDERIYKKTAYDYLKSEFKGNYDNIAFSFIGNNISYESFFEKVYETAKAIKAIGISKGERVAVLMPNIPETAYIQYACNRLGIICDFIDPRTKPSTLIEMLNNEKVSSVIVLDMLSKDLIDRNINELNEKTNVKKVITVPALLSAPKNVKKIVELKNSIFSRNKKNNYGRLEIYDYEDAINNSRYTLFNDEIYVPNTPSIITHSSGSSTGIPNPIVITNENMNSIAYQHELANLSFEPSKKILHILPYFAAYGSACCSHMGLTFGMELQEVAKFDISKVGRLIYKMKPNIVFGNPAWFLAMAKDSSLKNADFSFLDCIVAGGASLDIEDELFVDEWLKAHNCKCKLSKGYGLSEIGGCGTYTNCDKNNIVGYSGISLPLTEIAILDSDSHELVKFNDKDSIVGEAAFRGPSVMKKELNPSKADKYIHIGGEEYFLTGDTVRFNKDGNLRHLERIDRAFSRYDGYKVHPGRVEKKVRGYNLVSSCAVVSYFNDEKNGSMPVAFVTVNPDETLDHNEIVEEIVKKMLADEKLTTRDIPSKWVFLEELPLNGMSKIDYKRLEETSDFDDAIDVEFYESNLGFSYKVLKNSSKQSLIRKIFKKVKL